MFNIATVLENDYKDLHAWLSEISRYTDIENMVEFLGESNEPDMGRWIQLRFYTHDYCYGLTAIRPNNPSQAGYLGLIVQTRKPRAGESWNRGNDLSDGPYHRDTWNRCKNDIISYELVRVVKKLDDFDQTDKPTIQPHEKGVIAYS